MSKILRRPMFRGGPVDSRGTGITSGLMDKPSYATGGRVGFNQGGGFFEKYILGPRFTDPNYQAPNLFPKGVGIDFGQSPKDFSSNLLPGTSYREYLEESSKPQEFETELTSSGDTKFKVDEEGNKIPIKKEDVSLKDTIEKKRIEGITEGDTQGSLEEMGITVKEDGTTEFTGQPGGKKIINPNNNDNPEPLVIDEKTLIREQADLFKELLSEGKEDRIKKARIQDASDYLLKFFEGSQKEGATVGSSAADVAGFATSKDSRTEKATAANEKIDQTATALAINDYIAGKRSKEATDQLITKLGLSAELKKGNVLEQIRDATVKLGGDPPVSVLKRILGAAGDVEVISKEQVEAGYEPNKDGSDDGKYYLEEDTKTIYKVVGNKKVRFA